MEIPRIEPFLDYYSRIRHRTRRVVEHIPAEHLEWTPRPGKFTLGDQVRHLAALERWMFAETVAGRPSRYPGHGRHLADGLEAVIQYLDTCHRGTLEILRDFGDDDLTGYCETPAGARLPVWKWLRAMVEHEAHHRGQIYLLVGLLGVATPPLYGLTSEEVQSRSEEL